MQIIMQKYWHNMQKYCKILTFCKLKQASYRQMLELYMSFGSVKIMRSQNIYEACSMQISQKNDWA